MRYFMNNADAVPSARKPLKPKRRSGFWMGDTYVFDHSVVACITEDAFDRGWWAHGCDLDWQDSPLGMHSTRRKAERAAEVWVKERI